MQQGIPYGASVQMRRMVWWQLDVLPHTLRDLETLALLQTMLHDCRQQVLQLLVQLVSLVLAALIDWQIHVSVYTWSERWRGGRPQASLMASSVKGFAAYASIKSRQACVP